MPKKIYAVARGRTVGLFTTWAKAQDSVSRFPGAVYKSFKTLCLACDFLKHHGVEFKLPDGQQTLNLARLRL